MTMHKLQIILRNYNSGFLFVLNVCHRRGNQNAKHPKDGRRTGVSSLVVAFMVVGLLLRVRVKAGQMSYVGSLSAVASNY